MFMMGIIWDFELICISLRLQVLTVGKRQEQKSKEQTLIQSLYWIWNWNLIFGESQYFEPVIKTAV